MMKDEQNLKKILAKVYRQKCPKNADKPNRKMYQKYKTY